VRRPRRSPMGACPPQSAVRSRLLRRTGSLLRRMESRVASAEFRLALPLMPRAEARGASLILTNEEIFNLSLNVCQIKIYPSGFYLIYRDRHARAHTEVKLFSADGTAWETAWESRTPPEFILKPFDSLITRLRRKPPTPVGG
jgi:hypothetical protein